MYYNIFRKIFILYCLLELSNFNRVFSQEIDFVQIVKHVDKTPYEIEKSTVKLSHYLTSSFSSEIQKFASIYYWVASNIRYDDEMAKNPRLYMDLKEIVIDVMQSKSGVCLHYAELFAELSRLAGLKAWVVDGYSIENGKIANFSHAWNIVYLSGKWYFIEPTWANAIIKSKRNKGFPTTYFMVEPSENIKTHMPFDPIWQGLTTPVKYEDFDAMKIEIIEGDYHFADSISAYLSLEMIGQQKATIRRMQCNGVFNSLVKREFEIKEKDLNTSISNKEILKYNKAIVYHNSGTNFLNQYISLKNNNFKSKNYNKNSINALLDSASVNLENADQLFKDVQIKDSKINSQIRLNSGNMIKSKELIKKEREYVIQYYNNK